MARANKQNEINEAVVDEEMVNDAVVNEVDEAPKAKKYKVETPVKNYNGTVAGVQFAYGKAEVYEGHILEWFKRKGYKVTAL